MNTSSPATNQHPPKDGLWFIVPAAGIGQRMGAAIPKQYLPFADSTILETTLQTLLTIKPLAGIIVAIHPDDTHWPTLDVFQNPHVYTVTGGDERSDSVLSALHFLHAFLENDKKKDECWVLVHDAARPCISPESIYKMVDTLIDDKVGGILGVSSSDTLKQVSNPVHKRAHKQDSEQAIIVSTVDRSTIWQAQTPQMFRCGLLRRALVEAINNNQAITDEASALELAAYTVNIVPGRRDNIKITQAGDLPIAEAIYKYLAANTKTKNNE